MGYAREVIDRITSKVIEVNPPSSLLSYCWIWQGGEAQGYGRIKIIGRMKSTHRVMYEWYFNRSLNELHIDHLCEVRSCCNPLHLEAVTQKVNNQREKRPGRFKRCKKGHDIESIGTRTSNGRCKICQRGYNRKYMRKIRGAVA